MALSQAFHRTLRPCRGGARLASTPVMAIACAMVSVAATAQVNSANWGRITAPVYGTSEAGAYAGAELFAGPRKFGPNYFAGVLPNGRIVRPAGISIQIGMNPLGCALTPDGKYLITTNDDERDGTLSSLTNPVNTGGYSLSVIDTAAMKVVSQANSSGKFFVGLQVTGRGPYRVWASGGADQDVKAFAVSPSGEIDPVPARISISPITPKDAGFVSHFIAPANGVAIPGATAGGPTGGPSAGKQASARITFPAGLALKGEYLYVACNGDNSLAVIDTSVQPGPASVVKQLPAGYFPYGVAVGAAGKVAVSNWGITEYRFREPQYNTQGELTHLGFRAGQPDGFYVPPVSIGGDSPKTSSVSLYSGSGSTLTPAGAVYMGQPGGIDALNNVGDTHPSATAVVRRGEVEVLYVTKTNSDSIGLIRLDTGEKLPDLDLSVVDLKLRNHGVHGIYPNAIAVSRDSKMAFVAEAGINAVSVLDTIDPARPRLLGRIPTGWYPTALAVSANGRALYVVNAKGIGEDINAATVRGTHNPTGVESFTDSNYVFGSVQKIDLKEALARLDRTTALGYSFAVRPEPDTSVVPAGGAPSDKIGHVFFILHENKAFDSMLGSLAAHFGPFASTTFNARDGSVAPDLQFTSVSVNTQTLARTFATAANYYSDSEESDAGHQFCMSGTCSDYSEKTLLVKDGRGLLVNKNFEPEDYPEGGYIFNNAARNGVEFKEYGIEAARIIGTDTGSLKPAAVDDPASGKAGYPISVSPLVNVGDVDSPTRGVGQAFFLKFPGLAVLGTPNPSGEPRIDLNYPGYNFSISDQRRALEFCKDFDRMVAAGTLPKYLYVYQPNDHTGTPVADNVPMPTAAQQVADGDVALGMVVQHIMKSPVYYDPNSATGSAIFVTYDDAQSTKDHIHPHRTPLIVISPFARTDGIGRGYIGKRHYSTASIVKTEELLLGLPPNNLGDLCATDLRDLFQPTYNGISADMLTFSRKVSYVPSPEGRKIWALASNLDLSLPDRDSRRLGALARLSMAADRLHDVAIQNHHRRAKAYLAAQGRLYHMAISLTTGSTVRDGDD